MKKIVILITMMVLIASCGKGDKEVKKIDDIQKENGVPVRVVKVEKTDLVKWEEYSGTLRGSSEVNVVPSLGDRLEKIYVKVGDYVRKDQVIAKYELDNVQAKNNQARIAYENSKAMYERMKNVYESGSISKQEFDNITTQYEVNKENYLSSTKILNIKAPISGYVTDIYITDDRKILDPNKDAICRISNTKRLKAKVYINENISSYVTKGDEVIIKWNAHKDKEFVGKVSKLSLSSTEKVRGFAAEVEVNNSDKLLKSGIYVDILFKTVDKKDVFTVVKQAIKTDEEGKPFLYIADGNVAKKQIVELGDNNGVNVEVVSGLNEDDIVVYEGMKFLKDGLNLKIIE